MRLQELITSFSVTPVGGFKLFLEHMKNEKGELLTTKTLDQISLDSLKIIQKFIEEGMKLLNRKDPQYLALNSLHETIREAIDTRNFRSRNSSSSSSTSTKVVTSSSSSSSSSSPSTKVVAFSSSSSASLSSAPVPTVGTGTTTSVVSSLSSTKTLGSLIREMIGIPIECFDSRMPLIVMAKEIKPDFFAQPIARMGWPDWHQFKNLLNQYLIQIEKVREDKEIGLFDLYAGKVTQGFYKLQKYLVNNKLGTIEGEDVERKIPFKIGHPSEEIFRSYDEDAFKTVRDAIRTICGNPLPADMRRLISDMEQHAVDFDCPPIFDLELKNSYLDSPIAEMTRTPIVEIEAALPKLLEQFRIRIRNIHIQTGLTDGIGGCDLTPPDMYYKLDALYSWVKRVRQDKDFSRMSSPSVASSSSSSPAMARR